MTTTDINRHLNCLGDSTFATPMKTPRHWQPGDELRTPRHRRGPKKEPENPPPTSKTPFEIIRDFFTSTPKHLPSFKDKENKESGVKTSKVKEITNPVQKQNLIKELSNTKVTPVQDFFNPTPKHLPSTGIRINASSLQTPKLLNKSLMSFGGTGKPQSQNLSFNGTMKSIKQH